MKLFAGNSDIQLRNKRRVKPRASTAAALLAGLLTASALAGCGGGGGQETGAESRPASGQTAKGRYMETKLTMPEEAKGKKYVDCIQNADGSLDFYFDDGGGLYVGYTYDGAGWQSAGSINKMSAEVGGSPFYPFKLFQGQDDKRYLMATDENYMFHLGEASDTGTVTEQFSEVFKVPEGADYGLLPDYINVLENGNLLVSLSSQADVYSPEGEKLFSMAQDSSGMDKRLFASVGQGNYLTVSDGRLVRYNTETGEKTGTFELVGKSMGRWTDMKTFQAGDGSIYMAGQSGLYHTGKDGTVWEQLIDGSLNSMSRQDIYMKAFYIGTSNDYFGVYSKTGEEHPYLFHYVFDENADTVPPETLSVYSLRDNPVVRQAAALLQENNPQIRVEVRIAVEDNYEAVSEDVIRALNTELINGKGADVLILDGLPADSYRKKGILADMSPLFADMKQDLLPNVVKGFTNEDGNIYYMPARVILPITYGKSEAVSGLTSLDAMKAYDENPPLHVQNVYENILRQTAYTCYAEIFNKDGSVESDALLKYLEAIKSSGERAGMKTEYTEKETEELGVYNEVRPDGFGMQSGFDLDSGVCSAAVELINSIDDAMLSVAAMEKGGYQMSDVNGVYLPAVMAGINSSSQNETAAQEFIKILFSQEVQNESFYDGFTVRPDSYEKWKATEKDSIVSMGRSGGDYVLEGAWPSMERREELGELLKGVHTPAMVDPTIMQMIADGSRDYFDGKESLEGAVAAIENKIEIYMAEKE